MNERETSALLRLTRPELRKLAAEHPALYATVKARLDYEQLCRGRDRCERRLLEFVRCAWKEIEPTPFVESWHHVAICRHLEKITSGEIRHLVINIPPRHTKTLIVNVLWPAWIWCQSQRLPLSGPQVKFLSVSYAATLSREIALKARRLIQSEWYQTRWGHRVRICDDQKSRASFANTEGGDRISTSIEGGLLGRGGDIQIIDDPQTRRRR